MIEFTNAIKAILYERAKKPFTGTFALTWLVLNWRIVFTLFFVDERLLDGRTKTQFIADNYINYWDNLFGPIVFTIILVALIPVLNLGALFVKKYFDDIEFKKILKKTPADGAKQASLLEQLRSQDETFTLRIDALNQRISILEDEKINLLQANKKLTDQLKNDQLAIKNLNRDESANIVKIEKLDKEYKTVVKYINQYRQIVAQFEKEYGELKDSKLNSLNKQLFKLKLRGSSRIMDIT